MLSGDDTEGYFLTSTTDQDPRVIQGIDRHKCHAHALKNIVFIGDSLTGSFDWQKRFPNHCVTNLGLSGETVEGLLDRQKRIRSMIDNPDFVFLMSGINNIAMEQYDISGPYHEIVRNLTKWYEKAKVVVQSILPVKLEWVSSEIIKDINRRLEQIAGVYGAAYLDLHSLFVDSKGAPISAYLQEDGVHLSSRGYDVWAEKVEFILKNSKYINYPNI